MKGATDFADMEDSALGYLGQQTVKFFSRPFPPFPLPLPRFFFRLFVTGPTYFADMEDSALGYLGQQTV